MDLAEWLASYHMSRFSVVILFNVWQTTDRCECIVSNIMHAIIWIIQTKENDWKPTYLYMRMHTEHLHIIYKEKQTKQQQKIAKANIGQWKSEKLKIHKQKRIATIWMV